jgi:ribosomal protein L40E
MARRRRRKVRRTFVCPNCGADVPAGAAACRECGSDESTGWSEDTLYDGLDLPDPGYGPEEPQAPPSRFPWRATAILMLVLFVLLVLLSRF